MNILVFTAGLLLGSFLNVIIIRLPRERNLLGWPRCMRTGEQLAWWQWLPVLGWVIQQGHARNSQPLPRIYPLIELFTGIVLVFLYIRYGFSIVFFYLTFVYSILIITGAIDWLYRSIYTFVMLGATVVALIFSLFVPGMNLIDTGMGLLAAAVGFTLAFFLAKALFPGKSAPFGLGDVYLGIFLGISLGLERFLPTIAYGIFMAGIAAAGILIAKHLLGRHDVPEYISYGSYLCIGAIMYILLRDW